MLANLTLMYSKNAKVNLIKEKELIEIDNVTSSFLNEDDLKSSENFKEKVEAFYRRYYNYSKKIESKEEKKGYLVITFTDDKAENIISPIYSKDKNKLNIIYLVNKIDRVLKEKKDKELILKIYREEDFLKTDYNYAANNIGHCLQLINTYGVSKTTIKQYNKLIKIIKDTILINYAAKKDEFPTSSYFHARKIDDIISKKGYGYIKPVDIRIKTNSTLLSQKNYKIEKEPSSKRKESHNSIGDYYLDYLYEDREEKRWRKK